jgi:protein-S-isoprenylcysteine O-methyltransferase Ste14
VLKTAIVIAWILFWVYWLLSATSAKEGSRTRRARPPGLIVVGLFLVLHVFKANALNARSPILEALGALLFASGLALAVWARVYLGHNWGMPMTLKDEPELVTSGPYRFVRHPIYSGILLAVLGTALATDVGWLIAFCILAVYFIYSARVEEKLMSASFPDAYSSYRARSKMIIPFVLSFAALSAMALLAGGCGGSSNAGTPKVGVGPAVGRSTSPVARGRFLYGAYGCADCHSLTGARLAGPTWKGLAGSTVKLADGHTVVADTAYLTKHIVEPNSLAVSGYPSGIMAQAIESFHLNQRPADVRALVAFIQSLK